MLNEKENEMKMSEPNGYRFRVYKFRNHSYAAFYNDTTLYGCVDYMKRWNPNQLHCWYIVDVDTGEKFEMNDKDQLVMI